MMKDLVQECGKFRTTGVGIFSQDRVIHMTPPAHFVNDQMKDLFHWAENSSLNMLVKSCIFHYEVEFIHPFQDGNRRVGRMWQTILLSKYNQIFAYLPIEEIIRQRQDEYYKALSDSDSNGNLNSFVQFMLQAILESLNKLNHKTNIEEPIKKLLNAIGDDIISAKELMKRMELTHL